MKKIISVIVCAMIFLLSVTGCRGEKELDVNSAVQQLMSADIFDETLSEVSGSVAEKRLALTSGDIEDCISYAGTKAVVDEIVLIKATSDTSAENVKSALENHIETQKKSYETYRPNELPKLENAVVMTAGSYAVLIVSKDSSAVRSIIKSCLK